ncbi:hypothetical protein A3A84_03800 [Candidatus Collierbacteria bacterium RIFCSPLOWO2_01_FULL_50_23]|uniref:Uncharacterized protein n=1 Tax=Candidatus Collierbacteria bacterium RIFCSPHIGHO2_01_FULL_50_25 TaxID=1817722 RepID=A0A1F5EV91_9BACT|nr:MAG: hypothetical protein A2703_03380 [Candidatus Collierbacteria bacterium RIFCSPHIGHO2_01_FULL_50_25]OGD75294.1 MAG: hypothetical protein A3A84_03800 [Candidatus Collierbacteria bacterium RIFCSPLOWO2_01_FULL_50_23]
MADAGAYDQVLHKEELTKVLREKGLDEEKIKEFWLKFEYAFWTTFMDNAYRALPKEKQEELAKDLSINKYEAMQPLYKKVESYIVANPKAIDGLKVAGESAKQTYENIGKLLQVIDEGSKNGK